MRLKEVLNNIKVMMIKNPPAMQETQRCGFNRCVGKIPWREKMSIRILPGESHGQRSLAGYSPWGHKESEMTEYPHTKQSH